MVFLFHNTKDVVYSIHDIKMADRDNNREWREQLVQGWARMLIAAFEAAENRGRSRGFPQQNISIGRAGVTPQNWVGACSHDDERATCSRQEVS